MYIYIDVYLYLVSHPRFALFAATQLVSRF